MLRASARMAAALLAVSLQVFPVAAARGPGAQRRAGEADSLYRRALIQLASAGLESRRSALKDLEEASKLDPARSGIWLALGRARVDGGEFESGRPCFGRAAEIAPDDADAQLALGLAWKWDWLASLDRSSFARAVQCLARAGALAPDRSEAWLSLTALELIRGDARTAARAALRASEADRAGADPLLALACASYWMGELGLADSLFRVALPRLPPETRKKFEDVKPIAGRGGTGGGAAADGEAADEAGAFWQGNDPDLTTPQNEAQLHYMARRANALLLFRDAGRGQTDFRAELFVRYGIPKSIEMNPASAQLGSAELEYHYRRFVKNEYAPNPLGYPYNLQVWNYPDLGMRVELWDRSLQQSYELPVSATGSLDPRPDPALLAGRSDLVMLGDGRGVFRAMPPSQRPMSARGLLARFPTDGGARLVAHLAAPGGPEDSLGGSWAVVASDGRVAARASAPLAPSACDPLETKIVEFTAEVPPGDYRIDLAVSSSRGRRGLVHLAASAAPPSARLALSDLVMLCREETPGASRVRLEPNLQERVSGTRALSVYFEIDHLTASADGSAHFAYTYRVRPVRPGAPPERRPEPVFEASREETNVGALRRQFVSVPMRSVGPGTYDLEIEVRDLATGETAAAALRFVKE